MKGYIWDILQVNDDTFRWIVGGLIGLLGSISGFWLSHLTAKVDVITSDISNVNERASALEANFRGVDRRLDRIEQKIDYLIQGKSK